MMDLSIVLLQDLLILVVAFAAGFYVSRKYPKV